MEKVPLHPMEQKVLNALRGKGEVDFDSLVSSSQLLPDQVRRSISWLSTKGLVRTRESSSVLLTSSEKEPPELRLVQNLQENGPTQMEVLKVRFAQDELSAAVGRAASSGWITIVKDEGGPVVKLRDASGARVVRDLLSLIGGGATEERVPIDSRATLADLIKRGLVQRRESRRVTVEITEAGASALSSAGDEGYVRQLTAENLASIRASGSDLRLRPIDVEAPAPRFYGGRRHPVKDFINEVRDAYLSMGFSEIIGDSSQSAFWNFDALFTPQDHPARELQDTFYIKGGSDDSLKRKDIVARVASAHEDGWRTGSKGWRYSWEVGEARRLVLRTHNTALTIRATMESHGRETRVFSVGRVYRNENLDYKHLAELHQMEGIVIGEDLNLRHLMGVLTKFYGKLGMSGVKLWPTYFPYTEPSMQVMVYYEKVGKWLEMGGSGIFRPEVTWPLGVKKPVIAWGCGLERLLMLRLGIEDIRELYDNDLTWLRQRRDIASSEDHS